MISRPARRAIHGRLAVLSALLAWTAPALAQAPGVTSVVPAAVSADVTLRITGSGFGATAATNEVTFVPAAGPPVAGTVTAVSAPDATALLRRLTVRVPQGLPVGRAAITVRNTSTNLSGGGAAVEIVQVIAGTTSLARGQRRDLDIFLRGNAAFDPTASRVSLGVGVAVNSVTVVSPTRLVATVTVNDAAALGARSLGVITPVMTAVRADAVRIEAPPSGGGGPPVAVIAAPAQAPVESPVTFDGSASTDPDGDALSYAWTFGDGGTASGATVTRSFASAGPVIVSLTVSDGANQASAQRTITIIDPAPPPPTLTALAIDPATITFTSLGQPHQLSVSGTFSDASTRDLTAAATGTTYETSSAPVATVSADGLVTPVGSGSAVITARNNASSATANVTVALPSSVTALDLSPARVTLRAAGATVPLALTATFADAITRNVTADPATTYESSEPSVATVGAAGIATAVAAGRSTITARFGGLSSSMQLDVVIGTASGTGFVRGEVFDDRTGLPLGGATATLLADGSGPLASPLTVEADARGRFVLPALAGAAVVRVSKPGFTSVDRLAVTTGDAAVTLIDARLTAVEPPRAVITAGAGGAAVNARGDVLLGVPAGAVAADTPVGLTPLSNQGLAGRLPLGWSPVFALDVGPAVALASPATLTMPARDPLLAPGSEVVLARYDEAARAWRALAPARVSADGKTIAGTIDATGQFVVVVPDAAPFTPPAAVAGALLGGVGAVALPVALGASGVVIPRASPPGEDVRAVGTVVLDAGEPMPSGTVVRARVAEQFDLFDQSSVVPLPYTQDLVVYARPRLPQGGRLATTFPITPSLVFTIQQLALGTVKLDVSADAPAETGVVVGASGGTVGDPVGVLLDVPDGALAGDAFVGLSPIAAQGPPMQMPPGLTALGGASIDLVGVSFARAATLSMPRPAGLAPDAIVVLAEVFVDPFGGRRLRIAGVGDVGASRLTVRLAVDGLQLPGVTRGGDYLFVQLGEPIGLVDGTVRATGGAAAFAGALASSDTTAFADLSTPAGKFVVAGRVGAATLARVADVAGGDGASAEFTPAVSFGVTPLSLTLGVVPPGVVESSPAAGATGVPLNATVVVSFSEPIDPASVSAESVTLRAGTSEIAAARVLSADRLRVTVRPDAPLAGDTLHVLTISPGIRDVSGNALPAPVSVEFRTLDPSKPPQPDAGRVTAELPDEDGLVLVTGGPGVSEAGSAVTATNPRTQETITVLALEDGSFRLRVPAVLGDELTLTLREAGGRETTFAITQFTGPDGATSIGAAGGTISTATRTARIRPRALVAAGTFRLADAPASALPGATADFAYVDRFSLSVGGAQFNQLRTLTLSESQNRFGPVIAVDAPFVAGGSLVVPPDFLVSANLRFTAVATDASGRRNTAEGATQVVGTSPQRESVEVAADAQFPVVYLDVPRQGLPNQQVTVEAVAPSARVEFDIAAPPPGGGPAPAFFVVGPVPVGSDRKLNVLDQLVLAADNGASVLRTTGRTLPGVTAAGDYGVIGLSGGVAFITGRVTGPAAIVTVDGWPLVAVTTTANGRFVLPVRASATLALRFLDAATLAEVGTATVQTPDGGTSDVGTPLGAGGATMTATATPGALTMADIGDPIVFTFSEAVDPASVTASSVLVTDTAGRRVFGTTAVSGAGRAVTFTPSRRWRFGTRYRYGVAPTVRALSGAALAQPLTGEFSTFAPRLVTSVDTGPANDVAVSGATVAVAGDAGLAVVDATSAAAPVVVARVAMPGGARGVALGAEALTDRTGTTRPGPIAFVANGSASGAGRADVVSLATPATPALIGHAQLTTAPGGVAPPGVPAVPGTPSSVAFAPDGRVVVAVEGVGVLSLRPPEAVPADAGNPGRALGPRQPAEGTASYTQAVVAGAHVLAVGPGGLTVLDAGTMLRRGGAAIEAAPAGVAGVAGFTMDRAGDGSVSTEETFDLAVVAGGADGTVQFFEVPPLGDPLLIAVVRLDGPANAVTLDAERRLAAVGSGARGLALIDLDGPASLQPIDLDRDGADDRVLGVLDTPGAAGRAALSRSLALVADGAAGLAVLQVQPPRTRFLTLRRDPLGDRLGDESEIQDGGDVFTTDDAIAVSLDASVPPQASLSLVIDEQAEAGGARRLAFGDGSVRSTLSDGVNARSIVVARDASPTGANVALRVVTAAGAVVTERRLRLVAPALGAATLQGLRVAPERVVIAAGDLTGLLSVGAVLSDGQVVNVTRDPATRFFVDQPLVADVAGGTVLPRAGGTTRVLVQHAGLLAEAVIVVDRLPAVAAFAKPTPYLTLAGAGQRAPMRLSAVLTTGRTEDAAAFAEFSTSDPSVAIVDALGNVTAVGEGEARITARAGEVTYEVKVAVEPRTPPVLTAFTLEVPTEVTTDVGVAEIRGALAGTGSLQGLPVRFEVVGQGLGATAPSAYDGGVVGVLRGLASPGTFEVRARVTNPATGSDLVATTSLMVRRGGADAEPNDSPANATPVRPNARVGGSLGGGDTRDVYQSSSTVPGTLEVVLTLAPGTDVSAVRVIAFDAAGTEIARFTPALARQKFSVPAQAGRAFVGIESTGPALTYAMETRTVQGPIAVASVEPVAGGPGTLVTILGSGFSADPAQTFVYFGGAMGKVVAASPTRLDAIVPAQAIDGPVRVVSLARDAVGPRFTVGAASRPPTVMPAPNREALRLDPVSGLVLDPTRLTVVADAVVTRAQIEALVAPLGGAIVGQTPALNAYLVSFPGNRSVSGIAAIQRQLAESPLVRRTAKETYADVAALSNDTRDKAGNWPGTTVARSDPYAQVSLFESLEAVRNTPDFADAASLSAVKVAVVDSGFDPQVVTDFQANGQSTVRLFQVGPDGTWTPGLPFADNNGHGTSVTGIIGARNDGGFMSGVFAGLFRPDEVPPTIDVYSLDGGNFPTSMVASALLQAGSTGDVDVVNLSLRHPHTFPSQEYYEDRQQYLEALAPFAGRTLVVAAAGNEGVDSSYMVPGSLAADLPYVMSIGATAVNDLDLSGESFDARAVWGYTNPDTGNVFVSGVGAGVPCSAGFAVRGSNCGATLSLAAPGEAILMSAATNPAGAPYAPVDRSSGTSMATPIVTGVAAILQAIRPGGGAPIAPDVLRTLLVDSADDISAVWDAGGMRRLNALNAVRALLPPSGNQMVYVADQGAPAPGGGTGVIVGIDVDPFTGSPILPPKHVQIPLQFTKGGAAFVGTRPTSLAMAPAGEKLYAVVRSVQPQLGDGVLVVNTLSNEAEDFIPLSGAPFPAPAGGSGPPYSPLFVDSLRPGMVVTRDGRLMYVAAGLDLVIVNLAEGRIVKTFADLPAAYKANAGDYPAGALQQNLALLRQAAAVGVAGRPGVAITALALSPDGDRLYAAVSTGGGGGTQPGGVLEIFVPLYNDDDPDTPGLQSDLGFYLLSPAQPSPLQGAGGLFGGDEPGGIAASGDGQNGGRYAYVVNGGLNYFQPIPPDTLDLSKYWLLMMGGAAASSIAGGANLAGLIASSTAFVTLQLALYDQMLTDLRALSQTGMTVIAAPGMTGVIDMAANRTNVWSFTSDVGFGWNPTPDNGGAIVNQFRFQDVFAKRPFDITVRRDGRRAIVPFFQTGNFGVLDLDAQAGFLNPPGSTPKPGIAALPDTQFQGLVGVTPALLLDNHLWPRRGAWTVGGTTHVPGPDENFLYAWDAEYAQNGYFAVASHVGVGSPRVVSAPLPDFVNNLSHRFSLQRLGATFGANSVTWEEDGVTISGSPGTVVDLQRGGGGLSVISDGAIDDDFAAHASSSVTAENGTVRPYYSARPIEGAVERIVKYRPSSDDVYLHRPRGVTIQAFVGIELPRFGDHVTSRQPVQVVWRDARVDQVRLRLLDPATVDEFGASTAISDTLVPLTVDQLDRRTASFVVGDLMPPGFQPQAGKPYRIEARARVGESLLSLTHVDVTFDVPTPVQEPDVTSLRLTPRLHFFVTAPTAAGQEKALTLQRLDGSGAVAEDLSASPAVTWRTLTSPVDPILEADVPGFGTFEQIIRTKLTENGLTIPFGKATVEVVNGKLAALTPGVQAVQGCTGTGESRVCSNYVLVVAGLELDSLSLRPESVITGAINAAEFAANNLTERFKDLDLNPPMILAADDTSIALDKGVVLLQDVTLKFLGGPATLSLQDLYGAVGNVLQSAGPLAFKELIAFELVKMAIGEAGAQFLDYESANASVAGLISDSIPFLKNKVQSGQPGVTQVTGTLDLEEIGLGKASDAVVVWVLPQLESAEIVENPTVVALDSEPLAGPGIRTFATVNVVTAALFQVPGKYKSYTEFVDRVLPASWKAWGTGGQQYVFDDGFRVFISGDVGLDAGGQSITLTNLRVGFDAPNLIVDYDLPGDASPNPLADPENGVVRLDVDPPTRTFAQVQHKNVAASTLVTAEVSLPAMGSAQAQGIIHVVATDVELRPTLIFANDGADCAVPLTVVALQADGIELDVSADPETTYYSLKQVVEQGLTDVVGLPSPAAQALMNQAAQKIRDALAAQGITVPFAHGKVSIDATGKLTVLENGIELVWAVHRGRATRVSVVLAGLKLESIALQPLSLLTPPTASETGQAIIDRINEAFEAELEVNPPLVLVNADPAVTGSFLSRKGLVVLRDVEFKVLGQSKISVREVLGAIEDLVRPGAASLPQAALIEVFFELVEASLELGATQLLDFEMEAGEDVAEVNTEILSTEDGIAIAPKGLVTAKAPGIAVVKATLELDTPICNLGKAEDSVKVLVLPGFETLELKPTDTVVSRQCTGQDPVAKVKSIVCTERFASRTVQVPPGVQTAAEYVQKLLPQDLRPPTGGSITRDVTFSAGDFEFRLEGTVSASLSQVGFDGFRACFTVPNGIDGEPGVPPFITNEYHFDDPSIAQLKSPPPPTSAFAAFVQGLAAGETEIDNYFELITVSSLDAVGTVTVVDAQCQVTVDKGLTDPGAGATQDASGNFVIAPGATVKYRVRVGNTGTAPLENLVIGEVATLTGQPSLPQPIVQSCVQVGQSVPLNSCTIPRLEPNEILDFDVEVFVPQGAQNALLCNTATVNGQSAQVCHPTASGSLTVTKSLIDAGSGVPNPAIDPSGAPVLKPGETPRYRVTVQNTGAGTATNVSVTDVARLVDPLPVSPSSPLFSQTFTIGPLAPGASQSFEFDVLLPADCTGGSRVENRATVAGSTATTLHLLDCAPDLQISKRLIDPPVADGVALAGTTGALKRIRYQIRVDNAGTAWARGVTVTDDLQLEDQAGQRTSLNPPGPPLNCSLGDIPPGGFAECGDPLRFGFAFGAEANGQTLVNTATETSTGRTAVTRHPVRPPRLKLTKQIVSPAPDAGGNSVVPAGTTAVYEITIENVSGFAIDNLHLADTPLVINVQTGQTVFTPSNRLFTIPRIEPGQRIEESMRVDVPPAGVLGPLAGLKLFNRIEATNVEGVDPAEVTSDVVASTLVLEKVLVDPPGPGTQDLVRGSYASYEVRVTNTGTQAAPGVVVLDQAHIPGQPAVFPADGSLSPVPLGDIAPGQTATARVRFLVPHREEFTPSCPPGIPCVVTAPKLTNVALLPAANPPAWTVTNDVVNPRLRVSKSLIDPPAGPGGTPPAILAGTTVTYLVAVENVSALTARDVVLRDQARLGSTGVFDRAFALGTLAPGNSVQRQVRVTVPAGLPGTTLRNEARVNYEQAEPAVTEHTVAKATVVLRKTLVDGGPGAVSAPGQPSALRAGDTVTYRLEVINESAGALAATTITDTPVLEAISATGAVIATPLTPTTVAVPALAAGQTFTTTVSVTVPAGANGQRLVNRASLAAAPGVTVGVAVENGIYEPGPGGLLITEMVLDPRQDWSDSTPSNVAGEPFDDRPGTGAVDSGDVWVEIATPTTATAPWRVELTDAGGATFSRPFGPAPAAPSSPVRVLSGFGQMTLPVTRVRVLDEDDVVRQEIDVPALEANYAEVSGPEDESLTWSVFGPPTPVIQQFVRRRASIGLFLPF